MERAIVPAEITAIEIAIVVLLVELGLLVLVTFMPPEVLVPVGRAPDSVPPLPLLPPVIVANVVCKFGASVSATARGLNALDAPDVTDGGMVARTDVFSPELASPVGVVVVVTTLLDLTRPALLDDSGVSADSAGVAERPDVVAGGDDAA